MNEPRVIKATYAEWKMIKGRKVLSLSFELPLEQQAEVLRILGAPMPDKELWCAIAVLDTAAVHRPAPDAKRSEAARERYQALPEWSKAAQRAAILCGDNGFRRWFERQFSLVNGRLVDGETTAAFMRQHLGVKSRSDIGTEERAYKAFVALEGSYRIATGQEAEPR